MLSYFQSALRRWESTIGIIIWLQSSSLFGAYGVIEQKLTDSEMTLTAVPSQNDNIESG